MQTSTDPKLPGGERVLAEILYRCALKRSSEYRQMTHHDALERLQIKTVYAGVEDIAVHHFTEVVKTFESWTNKKNVALRVTFKEMSGNEMEGVDAGGLGRDFIVRLFGGLLKDPACALNMDYGWVDGGLPMPKAVNRPQKTEDLPNDPDTDLSAYFPELTEAERIQYQNVGYMQMYCFRSKDSNKQFPYVSGQIFHEDAFAAIQKIPYAQAAKEKPDWNWQTWLPVIQQLADKQGGETKDWVNYLIDPSPLKKDAIVEKLRQADEETWGEEGEVSNEKVEQYLKNALVERYSGHIVALHAMAHGMVKRINKISVDQQSSLASWTEFVKKEKVQDSIQGVLDREQIASNIEIADGCGDIIRQKVKWLQEWIRDETTPEKEIKSILRYITGASSVPPGTKLKVAKQTVKIGYLPVAHTCFNQIDLANQYFKGKFGDNTKDKFIESMLRAVELTAGPTGFAMA